MSGKLIIQCKICKAVLRQPSSLLRPKCERCFPEIVLPKEYPTTRKPYKTAANRDSVLNIRFEAHRKNLSISMGSKCSRP